MTWTDLLKGQAPVRHRPFPPTAFGAFVARYCIASLSGRHPLPGKGCLLLFPRSYGIPLRFLAQWVDIDGQELIELGQGVLVLGGKQKGH